MKFSIRDLFWLMLVAACCTLWWMDRVRLDRLQRQEAERTKQATQVMQFLNTTLQATVVPPSPTAPATNGAGEEAPNFAPESAAPQPSKNAIP